MFQSTVPQNGLERNQTHGGNPPAPEATEPADRPGNSPINAGDRPDPQWCRGRCPECGDDLVSNLYYVGGKGYLLIWECWASLAETPSCGYRRVL